MAAVEMEESEQVTTRCVTVTLIARSLHHGPAKGSVVCGQMVQPESLSHSLDVRLVQLTPSPN
jgi:hypothetical protein